MQTFEKGIFQREVRTLKNSDFETKIRGVNSVSGETS